MRYSYPPAPNNSLELSVLRHQPGLYNGEHSNMADETPAAVQNLPADGNAPTELQNTVRAQVDIRHARTNTIHHRLARMRICLPMVTLPPTLKPACNLVFTATSQVKQCTLDFRTQYVLKSISDIHILTQVIIGSHD